MAKIKERYLVYFSSLKGKWQIKILPLSNNAMKVRMDKGQFIYDSIKHASLKMSSLNRRR